ncbi:glutathione-disulfide reductase [Commensalibacter papalotli (ex Botero et al. 2024)]|uniref:Dihydrolipoamide dehydrogenase (E3) component of pyruvate/2-oxoglutarate dehydrogenase complex or glutathione oxidoreductase (Lpd) (PDB:6QKG) n=1 Tax=Commensalibacter papalotli (ex Botero et al. 2024) TaxID=2972766 RepID=A0ABM9HNR1_9PROT|nr:glutathione-disulfide reductase [Commensalibacter papalotli (ex Botero et al. 2024)]CAI3935004.1 Dihydrolipoamide dehydrogenase (E3) component of pyruvate/2-oxoglutarate dehydrogenase complex or glutathione oxidoreductase (Lpd) (PDB:6QKG) [Commensalibacter papalotli (ex Botero et al. 2024)]CAI3940722.1 Dihydrolipoamide dehydrogenase (E3) component of pyruvate/2-oxoglutarate dehydrogenase complex or glutathione oxidoreductase (Lpd) (PDB:6QKG) [Commensalibacter papalotli (ex Botero et al. 2024)]
MTYDFDLIVIGAGSGGVRCARIAAGHGAKVAIIEKQHWGGTCVNIGCVPKKLMMYASTYGDLVEDSHGYGWDTKKGQHHWQQLIEAKDKEIHRLNGIYVSMLQKAGVTIFKGAASFKDAHTINIAQSVLSEDVTQGALDITAKHIVIATGSSPSLLDIEGKEHGIVSDQAFYLKERPQRISIIGSGYIGIEFAGIFAGLGSQVDLIYRQPVPLRGFDQDMRQALYDAIAVRPNIMQHTGKNPVKVEKNGDTYKLHLDDGDVIETNCVFFATGRHPNISGLALDHAGVEITDKEQVIVDDNFVTSSPNIYAIGDVIDKINLTPVAIAQGHALADRLFAGYSRKAAYDSTPKAVFFYPPLASVGLSEEEAVKKGEVEIYVSQFTAMKYVFTERKIKTFIKMIVDKKTQLVVGLHMLGDDAPEIMQGFAVAIAAGLTKADFDQTIGIHPSSAEELVTLRQVTRTSQKQ